MVRSLLLPGMGQAYAGKDGRAILYPVLQVATLAGAYWSINNYNNKVDEYEKSQIAYHTAVTDADINRTRSRMQDVYDAVSNAESTRNVMIGLAAGIWLWNVLDAVIWPPEKAHAYGINLAPELYFSSARDHRVAQIGLCWRF